jgi:hypothetical protein
MKKIIKLTESDINRIVRKVLNEQITGSKPIDNVIACVKKKLNNDSFKMPMSCENCFTTISKGQSPNFIDAMACTAEVGKNYPIIMSCMYEMLGQKVPPEFVKS